MRTLDSRTLRDLLAIFISLPKESIPSQGEGWVDLVKFGPAIKNEGIDFRRFGFLKLGEFVAATGLFDIWDDTSKAAPIRYIREKKGEKKPMTQTARPNTTPQRTDSTIQRSKRTVDGGEVEKVKRRLRLENNFFIGQFIPEKTEGWYKIVDIRNTDFTKIEDKERGVKNLTISFRSIDKEFNKYAYYKFTWVLLEKDPIKFGIDLREEVSALWPVDIVKCLHDSIVHYPASAAKKITRTLDTLNKQLTQSGKEVFIYELLQNANDYPRKQKIDDTYMSLPVDVEFHITNEYLTFQHTGEYFNAKNIAAICDINDGEKTDNIEAIGYKGIGFKTVFLDNDYVYLNTGNYSFRFDKSATDIINTPWQILPVWTDSNEVPLTIKKVFGNHTDDLFRVKFALKPRDTRILTARERKDNYIDLFSSVFETERVILFIPNIRRVSVFIGDTKVPAIVREKNSDDWCVSDALTDDVPDRVRERINDVLTNQDANKSNGYEKIPEKYYNFYKTSVKFACRKEGRTLLPVENASLYCYLPAKYADWGFGFLMNTDMIPNGARDDIEDIELNHELAKIAGRQFFYWIRSLIGSKQYDLDSIFGLIPDFDKCIEQHSRNKTFIREFREEFEKHIVNECFVPVLDSEGKEYVATIDVIINDQTDISRNGVMCDKEFMSLMELTDDYLPIQELRESKAFKNFLVKYSPSELDINFDEVKKKCSKDEFVDWLKNADNNNRFISHLLTNNVLEDFVKEEIFIEYEGELFSAGELYYDFDSHCSSIPFLREFIPHLAESTRDFFKDDEDWAEFVDNHFLEFDADEMLDNYVFKCDDAIALLQNIDNSISFFKFVAEYKIDLTDRTDKFPYLDEDECVHTNDYEGLTFFYSENAYDLSEASWLGNNPIIILSHKYLEDDENSTVKNVFKGLGFSDFDEKRFIEFVIARDLDFCNNVNDVISNDFDANVSFLKYAYSKKDYLKEKDGQLKNYVLRCLDIDDSEQYMNADALRYFSQESYAGNTTFDDNKHHLWLSIGLMYCLDNKYFDFFPLDERKQLESFLRQSFGIKTFTNKSFFSDVVIANKKSIYGYLSDKDLLKEFLNYLKRDEKDIFDEFLAFNDIKDMPVLCFDETVIDKRDSRRLIEYDDAAIELKNKKWCYDVIFAVVHKSYSDFSKNTLQFLKIETFNQPVIMADLLGKNGFAQIAKMPQFNVDFWRYIKANVKSFESLEPFGIIKLAADGDDGVYLDAKELYISDVYQKDGIEALVRKYDKTAKFVSKDYLEEDSDSNKQEWNKLFKKLGLRFDNKDILFNSVVPHLFEIEDEALDAVIAMLTKHLKDLKENWANCKNRLCRLRVRTRSGQYQTLDKTIIINLAEDNVVEPFKSIELQREIAPEILSANKDIIQLIAAEFQRNCIYTSKQQWAQAKLDEYIESIQPNEEKRETIHLDFIRELATLISNDFTFTESSLKKLLFKSKSKEDGYLNIASLTLGTEYKPYCDFESNGIVDLNYLSDEYLTDNNKDTMRAFFRDKAIGIHQSFEISDIQLLSDKSFALYFWGKHFPRRLGEFEEWIKKGRFNNAACIPTEENVVSPQELYSPEIYHFAKYSNNWGAKVPSSSVVNSIKEESARRIFLELPFKKKLSFEDCLNYLLNAKERPGDEYKNRAQIVDWILEDTDRDEQLITWYREQPSATWRNGKGQLAHIKDLYVIHPEARQEGNIFVGDEHVMRATSIFPFDTKKFELACDIFKIKCLKSEDFQTTPINPKDETVEILKAIMPKILVLAAIAKPEKYQPLYEKYAEEIKKYRFLVCDKIDLGYESIHNDIERIYSDDEHIYYVNSWEHNRTYTKFCSKIKNLLGTEVYSDVCEDVLDSNLSVDECIEKYCSSFVRDESFRLYLQELNHTIADFEEEYVPEEEDNYYSDAVTEEEIEEADSVLVAPELNKQEEVNDEQEQDEEIEQYEQKPTPPAPIKTTRTSTGEDTTTSSERKEDDETIAATKTVLPDKTEESDKREKVGGSTKTAGQPAVDETDEDEEREPEEDYTEHVPGEVQGHHRSGCWVDDYTREDGTFVKGHWRSDSEVSPHTRELNTTIEAAGTDNEEDASRPESKKPSSVVRIPKQKGDEGYNEDADHDSDYDGLGQRPRKPSVRRQPKPWSREDLERMRSHGVPMELESLPPTQEEIDILGECGITPEQIADTNYLANLRLYNNLRKEKGWEPEETLEDFVRNADDVTDHKLRGGKYVHARSAARGVMYISPSVWKKLIDDKWIICVYLDGQGSKFHYINNKEEFLQLVEKDDVVIKITGKEKVDVVNELYSGVLEGVRSTAYTLIRVAARTNMDAVFAHYVGAMAEKDDGYDYNDDL